MILVHTADWHVGKLMRGRSRAEEHAAVLAEIATVAEDRSADVVLVAGDLFETAAPAPEAERVVYEALLALADTGAAVAVIGGNHDNPRRLAAVAPLLELGGVRLLAAPRRPDDGGVQTIEAPSGQMLRLGLLPFTSQRTIVTAADLMNADAAEHGQKYGERLRRVIEALAEAVLEGGDGDVFALMVHAMVAGGSLGGGERSAHTIFEYAVSGAAFPTGLQYVALGHLHRTQEVVSSGCPTWYPGSPLQLDFGEEQDDKHVLVVEVDPGTPATVEAVALSSGRRLRTVEGTLDELAAMAGTTGDDWLRVRLDEPARAGLAEEVCDLLPDVVDITVRRTDVETDRPERAPRLGRSPRELFDEYLAEEGVDDDRLTDLFDDLHEEVAASGAP